ncbi:N,N-dimethylformamidase beta subunit family domain-containing protein [Mesorhizobium sp. M0217]|uniref:N,N-dimethylformamidase beta subunit family domain-containing protein n=1 Tax=unclassified Mesorhizobium TaxID=325217 RepID=UPI00333BD092
MKTTEWVPPELGSHAIAPRRVRMGFADESVFSDFRFQAPREDRDFPEVFVCTERMSYDPGETVEFLASTTADRWSMTIYRDGHAPERVEQAEGLSGAFAATSPTAYMDGCDWPVLHTWRIPHDMRSGFYRIVSTCERAHGERFIQHHFVVVRPTPQTQKGRILFVLATATWTAYNDWGGANHYFGTWGANRNEGSPILSLRRPWSRGFVWLPDGAPRITLDHAPRMNEMPRYPSKEWGYPGGWAQNYACAGWAQFDRHFAVWAESQGYDFDVITQTDLHARPETLDRYSCVVTVGHDEYWSWDMRQAIEAFVERGGNLSRFGGNFLWQIRLEEDGGKQICWKSKAPKQDPLRDDPQRKHLVTCAWESPAVGWPGASTVGVNGYHGMYANWGSFTPRGSRGFTVFRPHHWAFAGTNLSYADVFGSEAGVFGYEVDGLDYTFSEGLPRAVPASGVPDNIEILAMSPAVLFEHEQVGSGFRNYIGDDDLETIVSMVDDEPDVARRKLRYGSGMMVSMPRGKGHVVTAGSCEWIVGLTRGEPFTEKITRNILDRFSAE